MNHHRLAICLASIATLWLTSCPASLYARPQNEAQSQPPAQNSPAIQDSAAKHPLEAKTELVKLDVTVLDNTGNFVGGLTEDKFRVRDNGIDRPIVFFTPVDAPARVVVMLETSPAVYMLKDEHVAAAYALVNGLAQDDQVALITYADVPRELLSFTTDKAALLATLGANQYTMGMADLNLYNSTATVVQALAALPGKKAIVLLSTGLDTSTRDHFDTLVQKLRAEDIVLFAVGLGGALDAPDPAAKPAKKSKHQAAETPAEPSELEKARAALFTLATITGGSAYFPIAGQDFATAYQGIAAALRHEYVLGIAPQHDGQIHKLAVTVAADPAAKPKKSHDSSQYRVSAREGYVAPQS